MKETLQILPILFFIILMYALYKVHCIYIIRNKILLINSKIENILKKRFILLKKISKTINNKELNNLLDLLENKDLPFKKREELENKISNLLSKQNIIFDIYINNNEDNSIIKDLNYFENKFLIYKYKIHNYFEKKINIKKSFVNNFLYNIFFKSCNQNIWS